VLGWKHPGSNDYHPAALHASQTVLHRILYHGLDRQCRHEEVRVLNVQLIAHATLV
jgi:hypothetical protein